MGRDSSVGIATRYGLDGPGDRIPLELRYSARVPTGPGANSAPCKMGTGFPRRLKLPDHGVYHPPHLAPRLKKEYSYTSTPLWAFIACSRVNFTCTFYIYKFWVIWSVLTKFGANVAPLEATPILYCHFHTDTSVMDTETYVVVTSLLLGM
jgi:hypothetical protein